MISLRRVIFLSFYIIVGLSIAHFYYGQDFGLDFLAKEDYSLNENLQIGFLSNKGELYIKNSNTSKIMLNSIKLGDNICDINKELSPGTNAVDINHCIKEKIQTNFIQINDIPIEIIFVNYNSFSNIDENKEINSLVDDKEGLIIINSSENISTIKIQEEVTIIKQEAENINSIKEKKETEYIKFTQFEEKSLKDNLYKEEIQEEVKLILTDNESSKKQITTLRSNLNVILTTFNLDCSNLEGGEWISIPGNSELGTSDFCVMKYEAKCLEKKDGSKCNPDFDSLFSQPQNTPWTNINQSTAKSLCENLGVGYHLITNPKWTTIARIIEVDAYNWADNTLGSPVKSGGGLYRGNVLLNDAVSCGNNSVLDGFQLKDCDDSGRNKRSLRVMDQFIWDLSGNVGEFVSNTCSQSEWYEYGWREWNTKDLLNYEKIIAGPLGDYSFENGVGKYFGCNTQGNVLIRGGNWKDGHFSGVYSLNMFTESYEADSFIGFRCAYSP